MAANIQDTVILFGDSLTEGSWTHNGIGARLTNRYSRKWDVLNRGLSGYNTEWALPVLRQFLAKVPAQPLVPQVRLLVIWFGANDAVLPHSPQHVTIARFGENLRTMVRLVASPTSSHYAPDTKIVLITPPPVNTVQRGANLAGREPPLELDRTFERTREFAEEVGRVGQSEGVPVVDVWTPMWEAAGKEEKALEGYLYDGLHLNEAGYKIVWEALLATIRKNFAELDKDGMEYIFPHWSYFLDHSLDEFKATQWVCGGGAAAADA
ncbi:SGNH hydrolase [Auriscalpium vulgare]|uniref:SGNH hydrolase n=1 Tax=Auriscalpium vulgare TaxID=40419 RepID=A0ACB8RXC3_9AGAM|nr:SGNH hydrolase [Auriscalpium vulgare]